MPLLQLEEFLMYMKPPGPKVSVDFAGMCFIQQGALSQDGNEGGQECVFKKNQRPGGMPAKKEFLAAFSTSMACTMGG